MTQLGNRPRIAVVTPLFPIREEPYRGKFIYHTVRELQQWAEIEVFCPIAVYPRWRFLHPVTYQYRRADLGYSPPDVQTRYFEYPTIPVIGRAVNGWTSRLRLEPLLRDFKPDLVLAYWLYPEGYAAIRAAARLGLPAIVGSRGSDLRRVADPVSRRFVRNTVRNADFVLTVSEDLRNKAIAMGASPQRVRAVLNGCEKNVFRPAARAEARSELGVHPADELVLFVGHLIPTKGLWELFRAVRQLAPECERLRLVCIGEGALRAELESWATQEGIHSRIHFTGPCNSSQVARWMAACNLLCLPSYSEGCPNVIIEALACARPIVATDVGGIPELVGPACGILVPAADDRALALALKESFSRTWDEEALARQFHRGWDDAARETFEVCSSVLAARRS